MNTTNVTTFECFTQKQVKEINKKIKENIHDKEDTFYVANVPKKGEFFNIPCMPLIDILRPWIYQCQIINKEVYGYDVYWDFHLQFFNYNVYGIEGEYDWHIDAFNNSATDMKLTCLLNLSEEPYKGGKFYTIDNQKEHEFTSGMGLVLTSLIAHKVTPVTEGERITLTFWGDGPTWK